MQEKVVQYKVHDTECKGFLVYDSKNTTKRPAVVVAHAWRGLDDFARQKARQLAAMGYVAFAADVYGFGTTADTDDRANALMLPLFTDRKLLRERITAAYETVKAVDGVDTTRMGAIGFCFGGLTVLELLRSGVDLKGVVCFHGIYTDALGAVKAKTVPNSPAMKGAILMLHGYEDPLVSQQDITNVSNELTKANIDWQMHIYGQTKHAFSNPQASDQKNGLVYNSKAANRSWQAMRNFFAEVFDNHKD